MTALPSYIDPELWTDFIEGRKEMQSKNRVPFTQVAQKRILMKLMKLHDEGHDANQALEDAICNSWRSVFPPKAQQAQRPLNKPQQLTFAQQDREAAMARWEAQTGQIHPDRAQASMPFETIYMEPTHGLAYTSH